MNPSPNQPILFRPTDQTTFEQCRDDRWRAKYFQTDILSWQFEVDRCIDADQIVSDPFFIPNTAWTANGDSTIVAPLAFAIIRIGSSISQDLTTVELQWYEININISTVIGEISQGKVVVTGFNETIEFPAQQDRFTFYAQANSTSTSLDIALTAQSGSLEDSIRINEVTAYEVDYPSYEFLDINGDTIVDTANQFDQANSSTFELIPGAGVIDAGTFQIRVFRTCGSEEISWSSEFICLIPENERDILISGCGNTKSFITPFEPAIRLRAELMRGTGYSFPNRYTYQDSKALFRNGYTRRNKAYTLKVDLTPEHVRDFVYMLTLFNQVALKVGTGPQIDLFLDEEPDEPVFPQGEKDLATITLRMVEKERNEVHTFESDCRAVLPPLVIGERDLNRAIQTDTDELIQA
jgi:hypothetical protein